jgi:predicted amidophosphoribosyltransferase
MNYKCWCKTRRATMIKSGIEAAFDNLIFMADDLITTGTAARLAKELGIENFDPQNYDF